ncbi:Scr1 family TA system antitoxin-like transcriptional regulator [Streptomyces sp. NPDC014676]|uniref:Scr1 family TA system antitoxin-like transcriptional regulator n=1 Tax=Streptomyces sp. NPDC014676 TaxID=3364879 RepID=UPI0037029BD8
MRRAPPSVPVRPTWKSRAVRTEEYARAVFAMWQPLLHEAIIEERVAARPARRETFTKHPPPPWGRRPAHRVGRRASQGPVTADVVTGHWRADGRRPAAIPASRRAWKWACAASVRIRAG